MNSKPQEDSFQALLLQMLLLETKDNKHQYMLVFRKNTVIIKRKFDVNTSILGTLANGDSGVSGIELRVETSSGVSYQSIIRNKLSI